MNRGDYPCECRWMVLKDREPAALIDAASFADAWDAATFRQRLLYGSVVGIVADSCDGLAGYAVYECSEKAIRIHRLAVAPAHRRAGVGGALMAAIKCKLSPGRRERLSVDVRETNRSGMAFLASQGFRAVSVVRDAYPKDGEDAYAFRFDLPAPAAPKKGWSSLWA